MNEESFSMRFESLVAGYFDTSILRGVSGGVSQGKVMGIVGRNGVGKTTLMQTLAGFIHPFSGTVTMNEHSLNGIMPQKRRSLGLSYAPQERVVFDDLSVADNLTIGANN